MNQRSNQAGHVVQAGQAQSKSPGEKAAKPLASQTLLRGLDILESVAEGVGDIADIAARTGMTYSTTHRILSALQQRHYLARDPERGYRLGRKLLELGYRAYSQVDLVRLANPFLRVLANETRDTVHLGYVEQDNVIYLEKISSRRPVEISSRIGGIKPLICTGIGKALILDWSEEDWLGLHERTAHLAREPLSRQQWLANMRRYAAQGYTYDLGEDEQSIRCVAAPLRDSSNRIVAAISVSSTLEYMDLDRMESLVPLVRRTARQISHELGASKA